MSELNQKQEIAKKEEACMVVHGQTQDGKTHVVGIGNLKVVIVKDGENTWFAQGLDIDYAAQGTSVENVKHNFENGLAATIHEYIKAYNSPAKMLKPAPPEVWQEMFYGLNDQKALKNRFWQVSYHKVEAVHKFIHFENIEYFEVEEAMAA
jgi:hypothetical protein